MRSFEVPCWSNEIVDSDKLITKFSMKYEISTTLLYYPCFLYAVNSDTLLILSTLV